MSSSSSSVVVFYMWADGIAFLVNMIVIRPAEAPILIDFILGFC